MRPPGHLLGVHELGDLHVTCAVMSFLRFTANRDRLVDQSEFGPLRMMALSAARPPTVESLLASNGVSTGLDNLIALPRAWRMLEKVFAAGGEESEELSETARLRRRTRTPLFSPCFGMVRRAGCGLLKPGVRKFWGAGSGELESGMSTSSIASSTGDSGASPQGTEWSQATFLIAFGILSDLARR